MDLLAATPRVFSQDNETKLEGHGMNTVGLG